MPEMMKSIDNEISKLENLKMEIIKGKAKGGENMKIAVSATGKGLDSQIDVRFGRCPNFVIVELDEQSKEIKGSEDLKNTATAQMGGAGISASQLVAERGVKAVITGNMGPRAFQVFSQLGISVYHGTGTVREAVEKFAKGELTKVSEATVPMFMGKPGTGGGSGAGAGIGRGMSQGMGRGAGRGRNRM